MNKIITSGIVTTGFILATGLCGIAHAAGSATMSLSPSSGTYNSGSTLTVEVDENGNGSPVSVVTADLSYNASQLQYDSASCGGSFSSPASVSGGGGSVSLSCFTPGGSTAPTGSASVGSVSFTVLGDTGSTSITFGSGSIVASNGVNEWNGSTVGGTYTMQTQPSSNSGSSNGGSSSGSSNGGSNSSSNGSKSNSGNSNGSGVLGASTNSPNSTASTSSTNQGGTANNTAVTSKSKTSSPKGSTVTNSSKPLVNASKTSFVDYLSGIIAALIVLFVATRVYFSRKIKPVRASVETKSESVKKPESAAKNTKNLSKKK